MIKIFLCSTVALLFIVAGSAIADVEVENTVTVHGKRVYDTFNLEDLERMREDYGSALSNHFLNEVGGTGISKPIPKESGKPESCEKTGNPVIIATGEKYKDETDFVSLNPYGVSLLRTYRSMKQSGKLFGPHWLSSFDLPRLTIPNYSCPVVEDSGTCMPASVRLSESDGAVYLYYLYVEGDRGAPGPGGGVFADSGIYSVDGAVATGQMEFDAWSSSWRLTRGDVTYTFRGDGLLDV